MPGPEQMLRRAGRRLEEPTLSVNEGAFAYAILHGKPNSIIDYTIDPDGSRRLQGLSKGQWPALIEKFRQDPKDAIATARLNIFAISRDPSLPEGERAARIERYVRAYLDLQIKLDAAAFPDVDVPQRGVPACIPDGLIDMGSDSRTDHAVRSREMLHVNKKEIFKQNLHHLTKYFSSRTDSSGAESKLAVIKAVAATVYSAMPYDYGEKGVYAGAGRVIGLHETFDSKLAQCRHHALYTQVLLQACGLTSRLLKCDVDFTRGRGWEPHAANIVRVNSKWYLLDATNPDSANGVGEVFLAPLPERDIDPNSSNAAEWAIPRKQRGEVWKYRSRNNMYHMIRHES